MKKIPFLIFFFLMTLQLSISQSIRKDHREMTQSERDALIDALVQLGNNTNSIFHKLADAHAAHSAFIHGQPSATDVFLAWHRYQIFELEHGLQNINPRLSVPYWDWTTDRTNSSSSLLWQNSFMGRFNSNWPWALGRSLGSPSSLPTTNNVASVQNLSNWASYTGSVETTVHNSVHQWVDGVMMTHHSPRDPIFYLHHGMIDKIWQDWVEANNISSASNLHQKTDMPRYDGTENDIGNIVVDPDDIVDSRTMGVFYANNQLAELENYTATNNHQTQETFYYQYTIEAKNDFIVPNGKDVKIESVNLVVLKPGFHAQGGSSFIAKIDADNDVGTTQRTTSTTINHNPEPFQPDLAKNLYGRTNITFELFPNPVAQVVTLKMSDICEGCPVTIYNLSGKLVLQKTLADKTQPEINVSNLTAGVYLVRIKQKNGNVVAQKLVKK